MNRNEFIEICNNLHYYLDIYNSGQRDDETIKHITSNTNIIITEYAEFATNNPDEDAIISAILGDAVNINRHYEKIDNYNLTDTQKRIETELFKIACKNAQIDISKINQLGLSK